MEGSGRLVDKDTENACSGLDSFEPLIPKFVELSTKFGKLLLHYNQTLSAKHVSRFSEHCVYKRYASRYAVCPSRSGSLCPPKATSIVWTWVLPLP